MSEQIVLNERYELGELLATGGMGEVWRATDQLLDRQVAVKLLRPEFTSDEAARTRFKAEARFAASLHHGGIAQVYDYGEQDDVIYLVMELVHGEPLSKIIARDGGLDVDATVDLIEQSARALQIAHSAEIIHRDVKPGNLLITDDGTIKITDFGIARAKAVSTLTQTGMVMGTAHYVSPEQASGQPITPASDLYSLGVVAFECLTGDPPFDADTPVAIALKHVRELPPPLPMHIPAPVRELVGQLLAKNPADRPASAQELADRAYAIRTAQDTGPAESVESSDSLTDDEVADTTERQRSPRLLMSVTAGVLLLGIILIGALWPGQEDANLNGDRIQVPATPAPAPRYGTIDPSPVRSISPTKLAPLPLSRGTTAPRPRASLTMRVTTTPTKTVTRTAPAPTPTSTSTVPIPGPSSPLMSDQANTAGSEPGP